MSQSGVRVAVVLNPTVVPLAGANMLDIDVRGITRLFVQLSVTIAALTGFRIKARALASAGYVTLYSSTADYSTPQGLLVGCSGDLSSQAIGEGWFALDVSGLESVQLHATSGGTAFLAINAGGE